MTPYSNQYKELYRYLIEHSMVRIRLVTTVQVADQKHVLSRALYNQINLLIPVTRLNINRKNRKRLEAEVSLS